MKYAFVWLAALLCIATAAGAATTNPTPYDAVLRAQLQASAVPVLLPVRLPQALGPVHSVAVIVAGPTGYYVGFSPVAHCAGALSCAFVHVSGSPRSATDRNQRRDRRVHLPDGTRAWYRPPDCSGASCTEAALSFERDGALYELDAKVPCNSFMALASLYGTMRILH